MGDFQVHRVRLFAFLPAGLRCLAAGPSARLAAARVDGALELYSLQANGFQEKVIPGHERRIPEALSWAGGNRLFGAGLSGEIIEYDLERLSIKYSLDAFGGPIWSMAADPTGAQLAVGCEDGSVKLFHVLPERIQFERSLDRQKGRVLSVSWHSSGARIAASSIDLIRVFDVKSGHAVQRLLVDRRAKGYYTQKSVVWSVAFLSDGAIVSADSSGKVQFWDSEVGTLLQTCVVSNSAVLCLAVSEAEDSIVVGTSEGAVYQFQLLPVKMGSTERQWVRTKPFQHHTHDVRAVAHTATALISGGLDGQLVIRPLMEKVESRSYEAAVRKVTFPHRRLVSCAGKARLLLFQYPQHLELWRLGATSATGRDGEVLPVSCPPEHLLQLKNKGPEHISSSCISPCGGWIAYSTASRLCLYRVQLTGEQVALQRVPKVPKLARGAHQLLFSVDSTRLFVASDQGSVHMLKLLQSGACKHLLTLHPGSESTEAALLLAVSADSSWLAVASSDGQVNIYNLQNAKPHCMVPAYSCPVTALAIHPVTNNLVVAHSDQQVFEFSILDKAYTPWSRKVQQQGLHRDWLERDTPVTHIAFNPKESSHILLHDTHMFCLLDKSLPLPEDTAILCNQPSLKHLPRAARHKSAHAFKICKKYQPLLFVDLLDEKTFVVVERPLMDIKAQLPPPVYQKKFGT
ncbi:U3 small nucleolar RNA-associated protein 4 homolog [Eublepharis macularius]|uniref:U3 small nucleolar RNA-associated protein 4 homolog n=1 Tax=Eublepharis macularius TaxID=481883 RepID=A0AA97KH21_EUBMA|nr:U3 small nucleolar RNA-associated protein 4 homolog [Eublepharis macularius]